MEKAACTARGAGQDGPHLATGQEPCRQTPADRSEPAASPPACNRGCISLVTFFVQAKKVTRPPGRRTEPDRDERRVRATRDKKAKALGPRLRGDDEESEDQDGFRPSPE